MGGWMAFRKRARVLFFWWVGGWVGGWVMGGWVEEIKAVGMSSCMLWAWACGGWKGGWVGGRSLFTHLFKQSKGPIVCSTNPTLLIRWGEEEEEEEEEEESEPLLPPPSVGEDSPPHQEKEEEEEVGGWVGGEGVCGWVGGKGREWMTSLR